MQNLLGGDAAMKRLAQARDHGRRRVRDPQRSPSRECTGNFFIDDEVLAKPTGKTDLSEYAVDPTQKLFPDFFL